MKVLRIHTLKKGWADRDHVMLHAVFQLLVDYVEGEKPGEILNWNRDVERKRAWREIRSLHRWWKETRPGRKSPLFEKGLKTPPRCQRKAPGKKLMKLFHYDKIEYADYHSALRRHWKLVRKWDAEDQRNLHRLVDIRQFLWT